MWSGGCVIRCDPGRFFFLYKFLNFLSSTNLFCVYFSVLGTVLAKYTLPGVTRITSCAFGGIFLVAVVVLSSLAHLYQVFTA